ncbi:transporter [Ganoderma sinense ZZ0214-1]|uniref:Transporter n=1 Tax=Ganoderma sinense ZZ0214-1 TaxID=1077348 RepID=A0A2G8STB4_9APHY|nr:transporter [Ganoderma sinense ZZ0214-1]
MPSWGPHAMIPPIVASISTPTSTSVSDDDTVVITIGRSGGHPEYIWYAILCLLALAMATNVSYSGWAAYSRSHARRESESTTVATRQSSGRLSYCRGPQAILAALRIFSFRWRIPYIDMMLVEVVFTVLWMGGCLAYIFAPTDNVHHLLNLQPRYWGSSAARVAAIQLPLVVILSMKNNPITSFTGIGHEKLNLLHRVISRCIVFFIWLHFAGMFYYYRSFPKLLNEMWRILGFVGAVALTVTTVIGIKTVRRRFSVFFYLSHVVLVLLFLITTQLHVTPSGHAVYVWSVWILWGLDRVVRLVRCLILNFILRPKCRNAFVEVIGLGGLRVTMKRRVPGGWRAGQHVFVTFPTVGLHSRALTIANAYEQGQDGDGADMAFVVRTMDAQTRTLIDRALATGSCELPAIVEGPYGCPDDIRPYSTCVFIAGGTGVNYTLARMQQLFKDINAADARATRVVFLWIIRTEGEYRWLTADLSRVLSTAPPNLSLAVDVHVTGGRALIESQILQTLRQGSDTIGDGDDGQWLSHSTTLSLVDGRHRGCCSCSNSSDAEFTYTKSAGFPDSPTLPRDPGSPSLSRTASGSTSTSSSSSTPCADQGLLTVPTAAYSCQSCSCCSCPLQSPSMLHSPMSLSDHTASDTPTTIACQAVRRMYGRPDVRKILEEGIATAQGAVAVDVAGPDELVNAVRSALCAPFAGPVAVLKGAPTVMLSIKQFRM